mmetsp:Transcript_101775/g.202085  ORF Transcript_101775/g.202085 Transcript_101775/m.202085 type:complete len:114 (-) Transcript_101775:10-351(-)
MPSFAFLMVTTAVSAVEACQSAFSKSRVTFRYSVQNARPRLVAVAAACDTPSLTTRGYEPYSCVPEEPWSGSYEKKLGCTLTFHVNATPVSPLSAQLSSTGDSKKHWRLPPLG